MDHPPPPPPAHRTAVLGAGAVSRAVSPRLLQLGWDVTVWSRDPSRAALAAGPDGRTAATLADLQGRDLFLLAVSDPSLPDVAAHLAAALPPPSHTTPRPPVALHFSGFHDLSPLAPLARAGWSVGSAHPLASFPSTGGGEERLARAWFAVAGQGPALSAATELVRALGGRPWSLAGKPDARARYHAAAALCAGGVVALVDLALEALEDLAPREEARAALSHLLKGIAEGLAHLPTRDALTGPAARGDAPVVATHLRTLPPDAAAAYVALLPRMLHLARARGLDPERAAALEALLSADASRAQA